MSPWLRRKTQAIKAVEEKQSVPPMAIVIAMVLALGGVLITLGYSGGRKTTIDVTDLIWKGARMAGFSLFAQSPTAIATAWRDIIPLIVGGSVKPIVERVYRLGEAGEALRHLIEDRPFGKVVLAG